MNWRVFGGLCAVSLIITACAGPPSVAWPDRPGIDVPHAKPAQAYYSDAYRHLAMAIAGKPKFVFGITEVLNDTGKFQYANSDTSAGSFLPLDVNGTIARWFFQLGLPLVDQTKFTRELIGWRIAQQNNKLMTKGRWQEFNRKENGKEYTIVTDWEPLRQNKLEMPEFLVIARLKSLDFYPGFKLQAGVFGFGGGYRRFAARVEFDARLVHNETGRIVAVSYIQKDAIGSEYGFEAGKLAGTIMVDASASMGSREAISTNVINTVAQVSIIELLAQFYNAYGVYDDMNGILAKPDQPVPEDQAPYRSFADKSPYLVLQSGGAQNAGSSPSTENPPVSAVPHSIAVKAHIPSGESLKRTNGGAAIPQTTQAFWRQAVSEIDIHRNRTLASFIPIAADAKEKRDARADVAGILELRDKGYRITRIFALFPPRTPAHLYSEYLTRISALLGMEISIVSSGEFARFTRELGIDQPGLIVKMDRPPA